MTEASVSSAFMAALRKRLPDAVIIKHRDASFIGLPDCSITYKGRIWWVEFKLVVKTHNWQITDVEKVAAKSPVQYKMMMRLDAAATEANYIVWLKKANCVIVWRPTYEQPLSVTASELVEWYARKLESFINNAEKDWKIY